MRHSIDIIIKNIQKFWNSKSGKYNNNNNKSVKSKKKFKQIDKFKLIKISSGINIIRKYRRTGPGLFEFMDHNNQISHSFDKTVRWKIRGAPNK